MPATDTRPNLLLITTDQQRFDTIHAGGNPHIRTPHLNWLCDGGVRFSRAYADCPICVPARATIMNGRHGWKTGLTNNSENVQPTVATRSLAGLLTQAGYQTRAQGKMHFVPERCNYGFEHMELLEDYYRDMARNTHRGVPMNHGLGQNEMEPGISTVHETHSLTHWTVDRSIDFLQTRDDTRPFFLWTSFSKPHPPFDPCLNYWSLYQNAPVPAPIYGDWSQNASDVPGGFMNTSWLLSGADRFDPAALADIRRAYYALITQIDYNIGRLISALREGGLLDNTLILFCSDHGEMLGDHHMGAKATFFEGSAHVPMLLRGPDSLIPAQVRGDVCDALVTHTDVYATLLAAAGVTIPDDYPHDGLNMLEMLRAGPARDRLVGYCADYYMLLEGHCKYTFTDAGGAEMLFDLAADPLEQRELIRSGGYAQLACDMRRRLAQALAGHSPAARDGDMTAIREAPTARHVRAHNWPGFHLHGPPWEILH